MLYATAATVCHIGQKIENAQSKESQPILQNDFCWYIPLTLWRVKCTLQLQGPHDIDGVVPVPQWI